MAVDADLPIIDVILADINAVIPNFSSLVSSYRLLVGAAEEIHRTPGVPTEIFQRSVLRYDRAGTLIDVLLELLCCKIVFASNFLSTVCAPIDLPRYVANQSAADYTPQHTAEQILLIELLRLILTDVCGQRPCFGPPPPDIGCPPVPPPCLPEVTAPASPPAAKPTGPIDADTENLLNEIAPILVNELPNITGAATNPTMPTTPIGSSSVASSAASGNQPKEAARHRHYAKGARVSSLRR